MDYRRFAALVRAVRQKKGWRQVDVAEKARVSQATVSRIERADCGSLSGDTLDAVALVLNIRLFLDSSYLGARGDALVDAAHARLVEDVASTFIAAGWTVRIEFSFNEYGERGIVDVLAWHEERRALVIVEVKSDLGDLQQTAAHLDVKARLVPGIVRRELGWHPDHVAVLLVLPDRSGARDAIARHPATFDAAFPARTIAIRRWIDAPTGSLRGVWFLRNTRAQTGIEKRGQRVRRHDPGTRP